MLKISQRQARERRDTLPQNLREDLSSEQNADILWRVCEGQHLSEDKIIRVAVIAGDVILGFLHAEDLAKEIRGELGIAPEIANAIAAEIDRKIFAPIRQDLEKNYAPPVPEVAVAPVSAEIPVSPESIIDLKAKSGTELGSGAVAPKVAAESARIATQNVAGGAVPAPAEIPTTPEIEAEPQKVVAKESKTAEEPAPVIIHKETEYKPTAGEAAKRSLGGIFGLLTPTGKTSEAKPVVACIEVAGPEKSKEDILKPTATAKPEPPKIRVVHYTELRTPFSPLDATPASAEASAGRQDKPVETPAKPPVSAPTPPIIAPAQPQKEEIKKEVSSPGVRRTETPAVDLRQSKIEPPVPVKMSEPLKILEPQKVADSLRPLETPKPFEPLRKPEPIKPFEPVKSVESVKPPEPPKATEPIKPAESPKPPQPPNTEEKKPEKPFGAAPASDRASADKQDKPGDEGDIIDLRTFQSLRKEAPPN